MPNAQYVDQTIEVYWTQLFSFLLIKTVEIEFYISKI